MRVSSALGTTRGEAERLRVDTEESDLAQHKTQDRKDFTRVPSDRHVRLAEMLASEAGQVEELKSGESCILPRPAEPLELFQPPDAAEAAQEQAASSRKHGDKTAQEYQPAVKGAESMKVETNAKAERSRDAKVANIGPKKPGVGVASSRPNVPAVSGVHPGLPVLGLSHPGRAAAPSRAQSLRYRLEGPPKSHNPAAFDTQASASLRYGPCSTPWARDGARACAWPPSLNANPDPHPSPNPCGLQAARDVRLHPEGAHRRAEQARLRQAHVRGRRRG